MKVVMSTHDLGQARRLADEVLFLHHGRLVEHGAGGGFLRRAAERGGARLPAGRAALVTQTSNGEEQYALARVFLRRASRSPRSRARPGPRRSSSPSPPPPRPSSRACSATSCRSSRRRPASRCASSRRAPARRWKRAPRRRRRGLRARPRRREGVRRRGRRRRSASR